MAGAAVLVLATFGTRDEAERAGEKLIEQGLAPSGSVVPAVHSFYLHEGRMQRNHDALLLLRTSADKVVEVKKFIRAESPNTAPEGLAIAIDLHPDETYA